MRWFEQANLIGDTKVEKNFLWFPLSIFDLVTNTTETRWLESAIIEYRYKKWRPDSSGSWVPIRFVESA